MKKFCLMIACFIAFFAFKYFHSEKKEITSSMSQQAVHFQIRKEEESFTKALILSLITGVIVYQGSKGFLGYLKEEEKKD